MSKYQKEGAASFVGPRVKSLAEGVGVFTPGRVNSSGKVMANQILEDQKKMAFQGDVVQITGFRTANAKAILYPWVPNAKPSK